MGTNNTKVVRLVSAGGVVHRVRNGVQEIVLCGLRGPWIWGLPKGTPDAGEKMEETALREVREETGLEVEIEIPIASVNYWFASPEDGSRCYKLVHFYLMSVKGGDTSLHDHEFDIVQWFTLHEALRMATYPTEKGILERAGAIISVSTEEGHGTTDGL